MFIGRKEELSTLNKIYKSNKFEMVIVRGKRRVGKTELLNKFIQGTGGIFFSCQEADSKVNLKNFSQKIFNYFSNLKFLDKENIEHKDIVEFCSTIGIFGGFLDGTFRPDDKITIDQVLTIVVKIIEKISNKEFVDINIGSWPKNYIDFCISNKIIFSDELKTERVTWIKIEEILNRALNYINYNNKYASSINMTKSVTREDLAVIIEKLLRNREGFNSWDEAFDYIAEHSKDERTVLVIDEFPYLVKGNRSITSALQNAIDLKFKSTKLMIIICGSAMSFMENILSSKNPLYGRQTYTMKIEPFDYLDASKFFPNCNQEEKIKIYGVLGGMPKYLETFKPELSLDDNIIEQIFNKNSYLSEEYINILKQELREPMTYNSIIECIANGANKSTEIASRVGESVPKCMKYIKYLIELGIIDKIKSIGTNNLKSNIYRLSDNYFKFWYKYGFNNKEMIDMGEGEYLYNNYVKDNLDEYISMYVFEEACIQFLKRKSRNRELPFVICNQIGATWWSSVKTKRREEIDIFTFDKENILFGECKWQNAKVGLREYKELIEKSKDHIQYNAGKNIYYILFSKNGFDEKIIEICKKNKQLILVNLNELFGFEEV